MATVLDTTLMKATSSETKSLFVYDPTDPSRNGEVQLIGPALQSLESKVELGLPIACIPLDKLLAFDQAAEFLNVRVSEVRQAIVNGQLHAGGSHSLHVRLSDLLDYRDEIRATRREALNEMSAINRELGLEG